MATETPRRRTLKLKDGTEAPIREPKLKTPAERAAEIAKIGGIKTKVVVDRSFYRNGR